MIDFDNLNPGIDQDDDSLPEGPAVARITGRLARIDPVGNGGTTVVLWLIAEDLGYLDQDGDPRSGLYQAIKVNAKMINLMGLHAQCMTPMVTIAAIFHRGQLWLSEILDVQDTDEPLPSARVPARDRPDKTDGMLIHPSELEKMVARGGFTAQAHSVYRIPVCFHLTMCPKYRARAFEGKAADVQRILRNVAEAEGMTVVAVAAEEDHVHVLLRGMTPKTCWSDWIGRWKALTSRQLKALPGLETFSWQVGYALNSVAGGQQGADEALKAVEAYIRAQGDQTDEPDVEEEGSDAL